jgi:hygromycin-B 7''-O-kinase
MLLPDTRTLSGYRQVYRDPAVWLPAMRAICERHGLDAAQLELAPPGCHVVFRVDRDRYIKLFSPLWPDDFRSERLVLRALSERNDLPLPISRLLAEGQIEGWPYLILAAVEGVPLYKVWDAMTGADREHVAARCGEFMAALHAVPTVGLEAIAVDWPAFVERQATSCLNELAQSGLDKRWHHAVRAFLDGLPPLFEPGFQPVLLSADVTDEHILVTERGGRWEVTGYIDFGDAMLGHPYYEFVGPGWFMARGSPDLVRTMLLTYGFAPTELNSTLADQLMAYTLLHRFVNVPELLELFDDQPPKRFDDLQRKLWSFSGGSASVG